MKKIVYITHPSTNIDPLIPADQWTISDEGERQIANLAQNPFWKNIETIYSSTEPKARYSAQILNDRIVHLKFPMPSGIEDLVEINRNSTGFLKPPEFRNAMDEFYLHPDKSFKGWETANGAVSRTMNIISRIMEDNINKNVAIVGHGAVGTLLVCALKKVTFSSREEPRIQGSWIAIDWNKQTVLSDWSQY